MSDSKDKKKTLEPSVGPASGLEDVKQLGMIAAIGSLSYVFWIVGGMEMIERLAFYGVKAVAALYATDAASKGGLGITPSEFGTILMVWALVQSLLPVFTGGLSDRYGYKETIALSTAVKICGYLMMAFFPTFTGFFIGAIILATGTAIFKPGIQGTLVKATTRENSSMAWGIFYQTVNIGGFLGPIVAGSLRKMAWQNVFFACAIIISINFLLLLVYKEQGKEERLERNRKVKAGEVKQDNLFIDSLKELAKTHVWLYLLVFSGFWFMFNALFDVLPLHIDQWVDSSDIVRTLFGDAGGKGSAMSGFIVLSEDGMSVAPEGMLNVNAGLIMITCFFFAFISGKMRATTSMVVGTLLATVAIYVTGMATAGWASIFAISIFSVGEMLSSPKFSEFMGNFAPSDKKAMYLGFSQIPLAIGWTLEAKIGPALYEHYASKDAFSRELLAERNLLDTQVIADIPNGEAFDTLVSFQSTIDFFKQLLVDKGMAPEALAKLSPSEIHSSLFDFTTFQELLAQVIPYLTPANGERWTTILADNDQVLTDVLYNTHDVAMVWNIMAVVGLVSAFGIYMYGRWILTLKKS